MARKNQSTGMHVLAGLGHGVAGIAKLLWRMVGGQPKSKQLNKIALFADWQQIQQLADSNDTARLAQAVQQADRFVDHVMRHIGANGATFADRLRSLERRLSATAYQGLWNAHKLRNTLAHQHGASVSQSEVHRALSQYRTAARELGAF